MSSHLFHLNATAPQIKCKGGARTDATLENLPVLKGMALSLLQLDPKSIREPHWHPNANELGYCIEGQGVMTIFGPGAEHSTFTIEPGVLSFVPMGCMHHIENIGSSPLRLLLCFNHESPEDLNLSSSISVMPDHVLGKTFELTPSFFSDLPKSENPIFICQTDQSVPPQLEWETNRYKFHVEATNPQVKTQGGWVKMSNGFLMPALDQLSLYRLNLAVGGVREPHWHPNAHELNYLVSGMARIKLLSPSGNVDTFDMNPGDMSFLPRGYLHHIENIGNETAKFAIFFNHSFPSDIGLTGCLGAYPNHVLASLFKVPLAYFDSMPKYQSDLFIVGGG